MRRYICSHCAGSLGSKLLGYHSCSSTAARRRRELLTIVVWDGTFNGSLPTRMFWSKVRIQAVHTIFVIHLPRTDGEML
jgi:hypothetical protein